MFVLVLLVIDHRYLVPSRYRLTSQNGLAPRLTLNKAIPIEPQQPVHSTLQCALKFPWQLSGCTYHGYQHPNHVFALLHALARLRVELLTQISSLAVTVFSAFNISPTPSTPQRQRSNMADVPSILLISLNPESYFYQMSGSLLSQLGSKANIEDVKSPDIAASLLDGEPSFTAVLMTDEALSTRKNARLWKALLRYIRQGGTCIAMGRFAGMVPPNNIKPFFAKTWLPLEAGSHHRTTLVLNREAVDQELVAKLLPQYSQKAVFIKNVASSDAWYVTNEASVVESLVFAPVSAHHARETPVAMARVGRGKLGYVGDMNTEAGSDMVVLAMCGLS